MHYNHIVLHWLPSNLCAKGFLSQTHSPQLWQIHVEFWLLKHPKITGVTDAKCISQTTFMIWLFEKPGEKRWIRLEPRMLSKQAMIAKLLALKSKVAKDALRKYLYISWPFLNSSKNFLPFVFSHILNPRGSFIQWKIMSGHNCLVISSSQRQQAK